MVRVDRVVGLRRSRLSRVPVSTGRSSTRPMPLAEMFGYSTTLRALSQGRATYTMEFKHYSEAPKSVADAIINRNPDNKK